MTLRHAVVSTLCAIAIAGACGPKSTKQPEPKVKDTAVKTPKPAPKPEDKFLAECRQGLETARTLLPTILAAEGGRTLESTLVPYNDLLIGVAQSSASAGLFSEVHPDEKIRDAARTCEQEVSAFVTELQLNKELYDALAAVDVATLDPEAKRFLEHTLRDFRRSGVDKDQATRDRVKTINEEITKLGQQFSKNIAEDVRTIEVTDEQRLAGLPADWVAAHRTEGGTFKISTDYPDYNPFMMYAEDDELRKELYVKFRSRGDSHNEQILQKLLSLRAEESKLLGYANWADYITEDKMMKSGKRAADFIERVWKLAKKRADRDYAELLKALKKKQPKATKVQDWQKTWLETQVKKDQYMVDSQEVRAYFPFKPVLDGLLDITSNIYDIQYVAATDAQPWHPDVHVYDVMRGETKLGRIYLDMHPREGKYKHAAQFTLRDGVVGKQLPEGVLVCNFPNPRLEGAALMEHDDVVTMFHEFGHLMHHVLGGHHRWIRQSGVATEWDFVEAPSQMFEEWAWSYETLARFAKHHETGKTIPKELVAKMRKADKFGLGTQTVQQMFYAAISLDFHTADPSKLNQLEEVKKLQKKYTPFEYVDGTRFHASFGHLVGYSAMYYTYMWSLVIAKDLLTPFQKKGLMSTEVTYKYRDAILGAGGTKDAAVLVKEFLGRDFNFKAFEKYLTD
jgi:thimet oligopeptidase